MFEEKLREFLKEEDVQGPILKKVFRFLGFNIALLLFKTRITPNQVTILKFLLTIPAAYLFYLSGHLNLILGAAILLISFILDYADGSLARLRKTQSTMGYWIDHATDEVSKFLLFFAITLGLYNKLGDFMVWIFGFLSISAYYMGSLLYLYFKAGFQSVATKIIEKEKEKRKFAKQFFFIDPFVTAIILLAAFLNQMYSLLIFSAVYGWIFVIVAFILLTKKIVKQDTS
ncbi:MAG: CDP-alcohol phosphatidyltransferase family protein [Candidatus Woesearchaeota archaeon]